MVINFSVTDAVTIDKKSILRQKRLFSNETLFMLKLFSDVTLEVLAIGNAPSLYIKVGPKFNKNLAKPAVIFFGGDDLLNSSFKPVNKFNMPIEELLNKYDPFERLSEEIGALFKKEDALTGLLAEKQTDYVTPADRIILRMREPKLLVWDWGRVRFFLEQPLLERNPIPILKLKDSYIILDGNHRACAAILRGDKYIPVVILSRRDVRDHLGNYTLLDNLKL